MVEELSSRTATTCDTFRRRKCAVMSSELSGLAELARQLGIETCIEFDPATLIPEQRIRDLCSENKCGSYGSNHMCPPHVGSLEEMEARLGEFQQGILLQYSESMDVRNDLEGVLRAMTALHLKVLQLEKHLKEQGLTRVWGMIGGNCALCEACTAAVGEPCVRPDEARCSLESLGIDVLALLARHGLDNEFRPDRITWTGCILFSAGVLT
jgi:predicted metal-binding protein